ncbi:MAG: Rrf2 family transcriptional regulator [Flavobacteriaceae bacterium]|nr:Rrf2 family transcriptional regulator [Flavobacteriaceae bacterium]
MLSNSCKYAIRAVLCLAINNDEFNKTSSKLIAERIRVPAPFLAKIFQKLSKGKIIRSIKGPNGGFYLTEKELSRNLIDIIECIDGLGIFTNCFLGLPTCSDEKPCAIHHVTAPFKKALKQGVFSKTIAQIAKETKNGESFLFLE